MTDINGPTQEAHDLINDVRNRSGLTDLIRHGKFLSLARARGLANVKDGHVLFPIPQAEVDANNAIVQNKDY